MPLPLDRPSKIVAVGLNYVDHAAESKLEVPGQPLLFAKWPNALIGPDEPIVIPPGVEQVDYEAELAVVIGRRARGVTRSEALEYVRGLHLAERRLVPRDPIRGRSVDTR